MDYFSCWPVGVLLVVLWLFAATPLMRAADAPPTDAKSRIEGLDGLRGFLALAVFFSHTIIYHRYLLSGRWGLSPFPFFSMLGEGGVSVFFMITGYLFWSQLIGKDGRPNWTNLYVGRLFRILPLYWFAVGLVLIGVVFHTGPRLEVPVSQLAVALVQWAAGGLRPEVPINGYRDTSVLIAGVTWTLGWEWKFYASLLPLSLLARSRRLRLIAPLLGLAAILAYLPFRAPGHGPVDLWVCSSLFLVGMSVAALKAERGFNIGNHLASATVVSLTLAAFFFFTNIFAVVPILMLAACFFLVANGATLFGLLSSRASRRLGNISFGIYLLQGPVLAASFLLPGTMAFALSSPLRHWIVMSADVVVLVALSTAAHVLIERPGIAIGKRVALRLAGPRSRMRLPAKAVAETGTGGTPVAAIDFESANKSLEADLATGKWMEAAED